MFLKLSEYRSGRELIDDTYSIAVEEERDSDGSILGYQFAVLDDDSSEVEVEYLDYDMIDMDIVIRFSDDESDYTLTIRTITEDEVVQGFRISVETN